MTSQRLAVSLLSALFALGGCAAQPEGEGAPPGQQDRAAGGCEGAAIPITPEPSFARPAAWSDRYQGKTCRLEGPASDPDQEEAQGAFRQAFQETLASAGCLQVVTSAGADFELKLRFRQRSEPITKNYGRRDLSVELVGHGVANLTADGTKVSAVVDHSQPTTISRKDELSTSSAAALGRALANKLLSKLE